MRSKKNMRKNNTAKTEPLKLVEPAIRPSLTEMIANDPSEAFARFLFYEHK